MHAIERPVLLVSCQILQSWTSRPSVRSVFVRQGLLPMFEGAHKRAPPHRGCPGTSDTGMAWCLLCKVVPKMYFLLLVLLVVTDGVRSSAFSAGGVGVRSSAFYTGGVGV